jgi:predicted nucleic acid-binding protein
VTPVFVDTSAFYALADRRDGNHSVARRTLTSLARRNRDLLTSTYVVDETITLVRYRLGHRQAVALGERLMESDWCRTIDVSEDLRVAAWDIFVRHGDQSFSFTDCTSFAAMKAMGLDESFTFDRRDFAAAGFLTLPSG